MHSSRPIAHIFPWARNQDWIEELLAKSDQKDKKLRRLHEEKNVATERYEELEGELLKTKDLLRVNIEKFRLDADSANAKIVSLEAKIDSWEQENAVLESRLLEQQNLAGEYDEEKRALIEQIKKYEIDLSKAHVSLKLKSDELDDALFSLDSEQKKWLHEKNDLISQKSFSRGRTQDEIHAFIRKNDKLLADSDEHDQSTYSDPFDCAEKDELQPVNLLTARIEELLEDNNVLSTEQSRLREENNDLTQRVRDLSNELADQRREISTKHDIGLKLDNNRLGQKISDLTAEISTMQQQLQAANKREEDSVVVFFKSESDKSKLKSQLNAAKATVKDLSLNLQAMKNELSRNEHEKAQHKLAMSKMQEQLNALKLANADLKKTNESLHRTQKCTENDIRELRRLQTIAVSERDIAYATRDELIVTNANLLSDFQTMSDDRDRWLNEKEEIKIKLDKVTADYEAGRFHWSL
jgi:chromosome segregation ATPase